MALDFPNTPETGQTYTGGNGVTYVFDGTKWVSESALGYQFDFSRLTNGQYVVQLDATGNLVIPVNGDVIRGNISAFEEAGGGEIYGNANVAAYLSAFNGNILPSANVTYSLGSSTRQWRDLWVSNNTIYIGNTPLTVSNGNLLVNGNLVTGSGGSGTDDVLRANVGAYQTFANSNAATQATSINTINANVGAYQTFANANAATQATSIATLQTQVYANVNVNTYLSSSVIGSLSTSGNLTVGGNLVVNGNTIVINTESYTIEDNIIQMANANPADTLDLGFVAHRTVAGNLQHTGLVRDASAGNWRLFSNVVPQPGNTVDFTNAIYDDLVVGNISANIVKNNYTWTFGTNGTTTLPTVLAGDTSIGTAFNTNPPGHTVTLKHNGGVSGGSGGELKFDYGNAQIKVVKDAGTTQTWTFGTDGTTQFPGSKILAPVSESITMQSDQYSQLMWENANLTVAPNMAINSNFYVAQNNATLDIAKRDGSGTQVTKSWYWNADGTLTLPGEIILPNGAVIRDTAGDAVVFGQGAGETSQGTGAVAIGLYAGRISQGADAVAIGDDAGKTDQGVAAVAVGYGAGYTEQGIDAVAVGDAAGYTTQGNNAIAIGASAGTNTQGANAVAIGFGAGQTNQGNNSIIINATGGALNQITANTLTVAPVRNDVSTANVAQVMFYNTTSKEITYGNTISIAGNVTTQYVKVSGGIVSTGASPAPIISGFSSVSAENFRFQGNGASILSNVVTKVSDSWIVTTGTNTYSFTVPSSGTYQLWVDCNIPNGILAWNATATVTNSNVPVVGAQYAWVYNGGGTPIDFVSIPNQFTGTANTIVRSNTAPSATTNRFDFGINNTSGGNVTVTYGYIKI